MCINFNGYHSGGSSFVNVNDCWLLQKSFVHHRYKFSFEKKKVRSPSIWFRTPKPVRIRQSGRTGNQGVTDLHYLLVSFILSKVALAFRLNILFCLYIEREDNLIQINTIYVHVFLIATSIFIWCIVVNKKKS